MAPHHRASRAPIIQRLSDLTFVDQRLTLSVADLTTFASVAEMVTVVLFEPSGLVETVNVVLVAPAGTGMLFET